MALKTKVAPDGHSWAVRLPKAVLELSGIQPGSEVELQVKRDRIIIRSLARTKQQRQARDDRFEQAKQDMKAAWDEGFQELWLRTVGVDE
jgi:antitoxin component of MazEF toxin-antitoxin module